MGLSGAGGAILLIPLLSYGLLVPLEEAMSLALIAVILSAGLGFLLSLKQRKFDFRQSLFILFGGVLSAPLGTYGCALCTARWQQLAFAVVLLLSSLMMWFHEDLFRALPRPLQTPARIKYFPYFIAGLLTGFLTGFFGVGGGFILIPLLVLALNIPVHTAIPSSLLLITVFGSISLGTRFCFGCTFQIPLAGSLIAGGAFGMFLGRRLAHRISEKVLKRSFAVLSFLTAGFLFHEHL